MATTPVADSDPGALSAEQQQELRNFKISTRIANERYLRTHRDVALLIGGFLRAILLKRPENIQEFAAEYFTDPELPGRLRAQLVQREGRPQ
ncbi:RIIa domain-containing protein 1 [Ornithorhynchus anatinus]|uniref:RIIa domain-containing protein 1 n=1 Tax=Ornithorhynchus anatinus TaxID=9258 RepID=UPI0010A78133|nr:RIIa domain-containing protein 1 [Ornithorhynchus anatinus]